MAGHDFTGRNCPDCDVKKGERHTPGCDVERCPRCGHQAISCDCIYEICGIKTANLQINHPDIYTNGPTPEMVEKWDAEWGARRQPWLEDWPGAAECRELGLWCKENPRFDRVNIAALGAERYWLPCGPDDENAREDLNRLIVECDWDHDLQKFVMARPGTYRH